MNPTVKRVKILEIKISERARLDLSGRDEESLETLMESLERDGLINPIAVMEIDDPNYKYQLIAGERRLTAATKLGWAEIDARIYPNLSEVQQKTIELVENLARKSMTWQEEVKLKKSIHDKLIEQNGASWTIEDTAKLFGSTKGTVSKDLKLAMAIEGIPQLLKAKTKADAMRTLDRLAINVQKEEIAKRLVTETATDRAAIKRLSKSYQVGDFFQKIHNIPDESVDLIDFDPPWDLDSELKRTKDMRNRITDEVKQAFEGDFDKFYGEALELCLKKLKPSGWILIWFKIEDYQRIVDRLKELKLRFNVVPAIWSKLNGQTNAPELYLSSSAEFFFYATKKGFLHTQGVMNVFNTKQDMGNRKWHPAQKPLDLWMTLLDVFAYKGAFVLSPFAGSGNILIAAYLKKMTAIGYDLNKDYYYSFIYQAEQIFSKEVIHAEIPEKDKPAPLGTRT